MPNGPVEITVGVVDADSHGQVVVVPLVVDNAKPTVAFTSPTNLQSWNSDVMLTAEPTISSAVDAAPIREVRFYRRSDLIATEAHEVQGAIRSKWADLGWERSRLGYPTSDEVAVPGGRRNTFQHGSITWVAATGALQAVFR